MNRCIYDGQPIEKVGMALKADGIDLVAHFDHGLKPMLQHLLIDEMAEFDDQVDVDDVGIRHLDKLVGGLQWDADEHMPVCRKCRAATPLKELQNYRGDILCGECATELEFA